MSIYNGEVEIYEFSRGFTEVEKNGKWISGGFGNAIDRSNYHEEIPTPIQNSLKIFRIPTGQILDSEVALIARVIDNRYCVLAVANYQKDNRATEGIVGYRYFWLDKESEVNRRLSSMDGVGTLLHWWLDDKLSFDMNPDSFTGNKLVCNQYLLSNSNQGDNQQNYPVYPSILSLANSNEDDRIQLHNQAVQKAEELGLPIAWAWNVHKLDFPEYYIAILCADEPAKQKIESDLKLKNVPIDPLPPIRVNGVLIKPRPVPDNLEKILDEFVQLDNSEFSSNQKRSEKARAIIKILCNGENIDWSRFFTQENQYIKHLNQDPPSDSVRYYSLLPLLDPAKIIEWLNWLRESKNQNYIKISFETQTFICEACTQQAEKKIIRDRIYEGISSLLDELLDNVNIYELCKLLFVSQKTNIWSEKLNEYVTNCVNFLLNRLNRNSFNTEQQVYGGEITRSVFTGLSNTFRKYQQPQTKNDRWANLRWRKNISNNPGLTSLANLLHKKVNAELNPLEHLFNQHEPELLKINLLSAICYQFSEGSIPHSVLRKLENKDKEQINTILGTSVFPNLEITSTSSIQIGQSASRKRGHSLIGGNIKVILVIVISVILLIFLSQTRLKSLTDIFQHGQSSSQPSLKESFEECRNISNDQSLETNKQIQKCEKQLKNILQNEIDEINKFNKLNPENEKYQATKDSIRESEDYKYIRDEYIHQTVALNLKSSNKSNEIDQYVLMILKYLKESLDGQRSYDQIIQPLESCAKKSEVKKFKTCISNIKR